MVVCGVGVVLCGYVGMWENGCRDLGVGGYGGGWEGGRMGRWVEGGKGGGVVGGPGGGRGVRGLGAVRAWGGADGFAFGGPGAWSRSSI